MLKNISLHVPAGGSLAIVGATGSGKTTLVNLIARFYDPTQGQVLIDSNDVRQYDLAALRGQIGYVAQDNLLFSATVAENIAFGRPDATREQIERAAKLAQAHDFILNMERATRPASANAAWACRAASASAWRLRARFLLDPKILILDDSMSALDAETEKCVAGGNQPP